MIVITDLINNDPMELHPTNKKDVGISATMITIVMNDKRITVIIFRPFPFVFLVI